MATWTYWRRWVEPEPLTVGALYRTSAAGEYQTWVEGAWVTVPGESIGRLTTTGDPMVDKISEAEALTSARLSGDRG